MGRHRERVANRRKAGHALSLYLMLVCGAALMLLAFRVAFPPADATIDTVAVVAGSALAAALY